jgi:hypothetical protein
MLETAGDVLHGELQVRRGRYAYFLSDTLRCT